jgi:aminoacrylate hydrolase
MPHVDVDGGSIVYDVAGKGDAVVLISGLGGTADFWTKNVEMLRKHHCVISYDHRGVARSTGRPPYSIAQWADDLLAILDRAKIARAHLVGHSTGGVIAQHFALSAPERVASLVLSGTWWTPDRRFLELFQLRKAVLLTQGGEAYRRFGEILASAQPLQAGMTPSFDAEVTVARLDALIEFTGIDTSRIAAPVLVLASRDDYIIPI